MHLGASFLVRVKIGTSTIQLQFILFLLFWNVLWIINDLLAPLSLFFHEFQQNSQFLRTISNNPDLGRVAYNHEYTQMLYFSFLFSLFVFVSAAGQYFSILYFTFLFSLFVFVSAAGQYFSILTGQYYTITALERDQYEVLWSRVQQYWTRRGEAEFNIVVLCSIKPHIDQVQV